MRKGIIAAIVAVALFAVGAFAATFNVTSEDVASGSDTFEACAENVDVDFETGEWNGEDFDVTGATATFSGGEGCNGKEATLVVLGEEGTDIGGGSEVVSGDSASFELNNQVGEVFGAAVLVEGNAILVEGPA